MRILYEKIEVLKVLKKYDLALQALEAANIVNPKNKQNVENYLKLHKLLTKLLNKEQQYIKPRDISEYVTMHHHVKNPYGL